MVDNERKLYEIFREIFDLQIKNKFIIVSATFFGFVIFERLKSMHSKSQHIFSAYTLQIYEIIFTILGI